jgi:endonuclease G
MAEESRSGKLPPVYEHAQFPLRQPGPLPPPENKKGLTEEELAQWDWLDRVETLRRHRRKLLSYPGVTGVDIGYQLNDEREYEKDKELAIRVHVERKLPEDCFKPNRLYDLLPENLESPSGKLIPVDVIEAEYRLVSIAAPRQHTVIEKPRGSANRRRRIDPLVGGLSIGSPHAPVGTLGALVWDTTDGSVCVLSNWHVLAGNLGAEVGTPCYQPGLIDQGRSTDVIARLKRWSFNRQTDAALAELTGNRYYCAGEILFQSQSQPISGVTRPYLGMEVLKSARSTGVSRGFIDGLYFSAALQYGNGIVRVFEEQIHIAPLPSEDPWEPIRPISEPGDSGSVWVTKANGHGYEAVGLHFAGDLPHSAFGEYAIANPMMIVAERLAFSFRPVFFEVRDDEVVPLQPTPRTGTGIGEPRSPTDRFTRQGPETQGDPIPVKPGG